MVSLPSASLLYALLILVPGFLTYKLARRFGKVTAEVDRFDKSIYTLLGSGGSFSILVLSYSHRYNININELSSEDFTITEVASGYLVLIIISIIMGVITGIIIDKGINRGEDIRSESTWQIVSEGRKEPAQILVVMNNGEEIWGEIKISDSDPHGQDLLLKFPQSIIRGDGGEVENRKNMGEYVFLSEDDISHVFFETNIKNI